MKTLLHTLALLHTTSASALLPLEIGPLRDSALPLSNKRILVTAPRTEAAPLTSALVLAGARPLWCPATSIEPLDDYSDLDDALMRLAEYDVLVVLCPHAIDAIAQRWLSLADGSADVVRAMLDASSLEIGALASDALHWRRRLGSPASVVPIEPSAKALADTLCDLGHAKAGARVLVATGRTTSGTTTGGDGDSAAIQYPEAVNTCVERLGLDGAEVDRVVTHTIVASTAAAAAGESAELGLLSDKRVDAICAGSAEELQALASSLGGDGNGGALPGVLVACGEETAACARELAPSDGVILALGGRAGPDAVVEALEEQFGAGRLLF